ncbi:MAG TPA: ATPase domain-containing protein [Methanocella sp.]|uniref:RAD55 family ATPase n=1 Tax=Methanocella sp. TaxID=2052833 RepID=UPI002C07C534|nr:ATPase domain-containing protein [Methanocella sp.]HTY91356.1 ATPase domain-containing protein [Methanocella sp.]
MGDRVASNPSGNEPAVEIARLPTGVDILDRNLNGGLPSGALVYFSANPKSMPEVFLFELTIPRKTYYITTHKNPRYIKRHMMELDFESNNVEFIDLHDEYYHKILHDTPDRQWASKKLVQYINEWLDSLKIRNEKNFTIIFDSFSFLLEVGIESDTLKPILDKIYDIINDGNSICYLMMIKGIHHESVENRVQYWCDVIFDIDLERKGDKIINKLTLPKIRGMSPITDFIKFRVTDRITIDTSRDIA